MRSTVVIITLGLVFLSCEKRLDDLRENPNALTTIDDAALFTKAVRSVFQGTTDNASSHFAGMHAHYYVAGSTWRAPDQYGDGHDGDYNSILNGLYGGTIRHIEDVLEITTAEGTKNPVRNAMADVIAVLGFAKITDAYGEVPYTEGGKGKTEDIVQPRYDTQESIYRDMIERLSNSIAVLKNADPAEGYPDSDPIFNNDMDKWVRFANSVRLRLAMRVRFADSALSSATVALCLDEPLMESVDHDAFMIETEGTGNAWFNRRTGFPSIKMSTMLIDQLQSTADPRLPVFVSQDGNGEYSGMINGLTDVAFGGSDFANKSDMGLQLSSPESKLYVITASEVWLLRAEAALVFDNDPTAANTLFRMGIETSLHQWEIDPTDIATFMGSPSATLAGINDEEQIGVQMWLALVPNYFEGWIHIRRTGYPIIPVREDADLHPGVTNGIMPTRFKYSSFELGSNTNNVTEAINRQGPNAIDTPVWWDKN
ncbi:SusD/RagB family nutrient-binding outer membrane lipoprotein [Flagellimonas myxillae]|uniref:SusD/RagB family nutrient-binding outer membrane lipoprotein n=1 Tax=Flagellimonas myxillae TaxID=2942214 RepID=UPI00201F71BC|nr:SusD/RagB family nutrient-binding outer membrane lipoprotein [Muricauda myxillae]MCL6267056.1 SusD/RagB family nutrient-binding outer membrane lipoprotein [Muricauda myxillae]